MQREELDDRSVRLGPPALVRLRGHEDERIPVPTCDNEGQILYSSPRVRVGHFARPTTDPRFRFSGVTGEHVLVFARWSVRLQRMGEEPFVTDSMVVPLFNPDQIYFRHGLSHQGERANWLGVDASVLSELLTEAGRPVTAAHERLWNLAYVPCEAWSYLVQAELVALLEARPATDEELVERTVRALVRRTLRQEILAQERELSSLLRDSTEQRSRLLVERARALFVQEPVDDDSLATIAARLECSPSTLNRAFRHRLDVPVHQYRLQRRLRNALAELRAGTADVGEMARHCGFASHSHFTTSFRTKLGVTPFWVTRRPSRERLERLLDREPA